MTRRSLADIVADVTHVVCRLCDAAPGTPCDSGGAVHITRVRSAYQLERISNEEVQTVLHAACVFTNHTLIRPDGTSYGTAMAS